MRQYHGDAELILCGPWIRSTMFLPVHLFHRCITVYYPVYFFLSSEINLEGILHLLFHISPRGYKFFLLIGGPLHLTISESLKCANESQFAFCNVTEVDLSYRKVYRFYDKLKTFLIHFLKVLWLFWVAVLTLELLVKGGIDNYALYQFHITFCSCSFKFGPWTLLFSLQYTLNRGRQWCHCMCWWSLSSTVNKHIFLKRSYGLDTA